MLTLLLAFQAGVSSAPPTTRPRPEVASLVARARSARFQQDSALGRYEAIARQRMSIKIGLSRSLGLGPLTPERLAARFESVARVGWDHALGAWGELIGARSVFPIFGAVEPEGDDDDIALVLPYHPGRERLWPMSELREAVPNPDDWIVHPLSNGADSLYVFSLGDSLAIKLPDRSTVRLREIRVRARRPASRLIVGSLWVDVATGNLVRAAYRPSVPMDLWPLMEREVNGGDRDMVKRLGPFTGTVREVIVEHGLYEGRFWLPRTRIASAEGSAKGGRVLMEITQTFEYQSVATIPANMIASRDTTAVDVDQQGRVGRPVWRGDHQRSQRCRARGDTSTVRWSADSLLRDEKLGTMYSENVRFRVLVPCDQQSLATSPLLPPSIYGSGEALFSGTDLRALRAEAEGALGISEQAEWSPQPIGIHYGFERGQLRYNRVEGLSAGVLGEREMGRGYSELGSLRFGLADHEVNGEFSLRRSNTRSDVTATLYRRLAVANEWEDALGVGASISSALFGRDDGFYFRTLGAEVTGTHRSTTDGSAIGWRLFAERQDSAIVRTQWSLAKSMNGHRFVPNISAREGMYYGASVGSGFSWGADPLGTRVTGSGAIEGATGETSYAKVSSDLGITHGLVREAVGSLRASAGTATPGVPIQRMWYLGGPHTVRGHAPGDAIGDTYWFGRAEIAVGNPLVRPSVFGDIGWAGARSNFAKDVKPLSAIGAGAAFLDGLVRFDVARGLDRGRRWRIDFYMEAR